MSGSVRAVQQLKANVYERTLTQDIRNCRNGRMIPAYFLIYYEISVEIKRMTGLQMTFSEHYMIPVLYFFGQSCHEQCTQKKAIRWLRLRPGGGQEVLISTHQRNEAVASMKVRSPSMPNVLRSGLEFCCATPVALGLSTQMVGSGATSPTVAPGASVREIDPVRLPPALELFDAAVADASRPSLAVLRLL